MGNDINSVVLVGRLTRESEIRYTNGGMAILTFSLAVGKRVKKGDKWEDEADFFDCKMFGKGAESVSKYLEKGKQVAISGTLSQSRWEKDGQKYSKVEVIANTLQLLGGNQTHEERPQSTQRQNVQNSVVPPEDFTGDEIPF
jgi:single-strand DNA-binding protein